MLINVFTSRAEETSAGEYTVSYRYLPQYNSTLNSEYTNLGYYSQNDLSFDSTWSNKHTYTISASGDSTPVDIYSIIDSYNDFTFSLKAQIENNNHSYVRLFKIINMNVYYQFNPSSVLSEGKIKGSVNTYISDDNLTKGYTDCYLQGKLRTTGEWVVLKTIEVHNGTTAFFEWEGTDAKPSFNYSAYRINFSYWNWNYDGLTLASWTTTLDTVKICSASFSGVETNDFEKKLDDLISRQDSIISKLSDITNDISNLGDLIVNLPDLILDGVYNLFVPDDIQTIFNDKVEVLKTKMGILFLPFDFVLTELEYILDYNPKSTITLPELKVMNEPIMDRTTFDIADVGSMRVSSDDDWDKVTIIEIVRFFTTLLIIYSIVHLAIDLAEALFGWYMKDVHEDISPEWIDDTKDRGD